MDSLSGGQAYPDGEESRSDDDRCAQDECNGWLCGRYMCTVQDKMSRIPFGRLLLEWLWSGKSVA